MFPQQRLGILNVVYSGDPFFSSLSWCLFPVGGGVSCLPKDLISPVWLPVSLCSFTASPPPRKVLLLGLRHSGLLAELKALHAQSQELESAVGQRHLLLWELQAKRQRILQWRQLVEERQEQIRLLIKGNSASKTRLSRGPEDPD